ncbi:uncharacterized protein LOC124434181 [Xenia sp. Carnegie-2017]|nr:uncharacterized protein LOC124434181 [Xenia sp. Carnegie-2017]
MVLPRTADIDKKGKRKWKVARVRDFWLKAEKPLFWPPHIPFVSPSARINQPSEDDYDEEEFDDKTERSRKILNKKELIEIALSYGEYVHEFTGNEKNEETTQSFGQGRQEKTNRDANVGKDTYTSEEDKRSDESEKREDFENKFDNEAALNNIKEDERVNERPGNYKKQRTKNERFFLYPSGRGYTISEFTTDERHVRKKRNSLYCSRNVKRPPKIC